MGITLFLINNRMFFDLHFIEKPTFFLKYISQIVFFYIFTERNRTVWKIIQSHLL